VKPVSPRDIGLSQVDIKLSQPEQLKQPTFQPNALGSLPQETNNNPKGQEPPLSDDFVQLHEGDVEEREDNVPEDDVERREDFVEAKADYVSSNNEDLSFKKGDIIKILRRNEDGWWDAYLNGAVGQVPSNYIKEVDTPPVNMTNPELLEAEIDELLLPNNPPLDPANTPALPARPKSYYMKKAQEAQGIPLDYAPKRGGLTTGPQNEAPTN